MNLPLAIAKEGADMPFFGSNCKIQQAESEYDDE
jgi:hypothetical protein